MPDNVFGTLVIFLTVQIYNIASGTWRTKTVQLYSENCTQTEARERFDAFFGNNLFASRRDVKGEWRAVVTL